jgi:hypothetical protein
LSAINRLQQRKSINKKKKKIESDRNAKNNKNLSFNLFVKKWSKRKIKERKKTK